MTPEDFQRQDIRIIASIVSVDTLIVAPVQSFQTNRLKSKLSGLATLEISRSVWTRSQRRKHNELRIEARCAAGKTSLDSNHQVSCTKERNERENRS
jgi:hypothetical protein